VRDAIVVGSGPNGLAAAIAIAAAGRSVLVLEAAADVGGGLRTAELTLPGFRHDVCSAIHPLGVASPFLRTLPLERHGLEWIEPPAALAHPLDDGPAVLLEQSPLTTAGGLDVDAERYRQLLDPLVSSADELLAELLRPAVHPPRHPLLLARFAAHAVRPAARLARSRFETARARALFAGLAAHSLLPLDERPSAAFGLLLAVLGHTTGWPFPRGGSQALADALAAHLRSLGGEIETGTEVTSLDELPETRAVLLDLAPRDVVRVAGRLLPGRYRRRLERYRYGTGCFKVDLALAGPIPWRDPACARAGTVHLGGTLEEIVASEAAVGAGRLPERPFVLLAQQSLFDSTRAPAGQHTVWAYCHVPNGSDADLTEPILDQIERFAPGLRDRVLACRTHGPRELERYNANYVGGDINGGRQDLRQTFARPVAGLSPYATPVPGLFLCSASTPPGGGVHGMCGYWAAQAALRGPLRCLR
jgi:phytoene dehydrogenase-like protein